MTTKQAKTSNPSLLRILNGTAIALIALSVLAQSIGLGITLSGGAETENPGLFLIFGYLRMAIVPGALLAFAKFLLNALRSFRDAKARIKAVVYFVIALWPLVVSMLISVNSMHTMPDPTSREAAESEQFLAGHDWAKEKLPSKGSECPGSQEFIRGCRSSIAERRRQQFLAGRDWAKENRPAKASECQGSPNFIKGCWNFFGEHLAKPKPAGQGRYEGMSTAECKVEVNANYEASAQLDLEDGNPRAAEVTRRKHWLPELEDCENYDKRVDNTFMPKAYDRLQQLLDKMKAGATVSEDEKVGMLQDFTQMSKVRDQPYRAAYLKMADEYFERQDGLYKEPVTVYAKISCEEYQAKIEAMRNLDKERVTAMQALKRADGVITDDAKHNHLNQQRIDMLWEWKYYTDGAKAAGCEIKRN